MKSMNKPSPNSKSQLPNHQPPIQCALPLFRSLAFRIPHSAFGRLWNLDSRPLASLGSPNLTNYHLFAPIRANSHYKRSRTPSSTKSTTAPHRTFFHAGQGLSARGHDWTLHRSPSNPNYSAPIRSNPNLKRFSILCSAFCTSPTASPKHRSTETPPHGQPLSKCSC